MQTITLEKNGKKFTVNDRRTNCKCNQQNKNMSFQTNSGPGKKLLPTGSRRKANGSIQTQKERLAESAKKDKKESKTQQNQNANSGPGETLLPTGVN